MPDRRALLASLAGGAPAAPAAAPGKHRPSAPPARAPACFAGMSTNGVNRAAGWRFFGADTRSDPQPTVVEDDGVSVDGHEAVDLRASALAEVARRVAERFGAPSGRVEVVVVVP